MRPLFVLALVVLSALSARAAAPGVPPNAAKYLPVLVQVQRSTWADAPTPAFLAAQVEQESCVRLTSPKCWDPHVELKTSREYGFGLGQTTIAYRLDGSVRFNKWAELRARYPSLRAWTWQDRFDPRFQLTALVEMDHSLFKLWPDAATPREHLAFALSSYNGGQGDVRQDRLLCRNSPGCDPTRWFGNTELHSVKAHVPYKGYAKSPFDINREYPRNVLGVRLPKYLPFFRE